MNLGAFSISLAVSDLQASKDFYQKLDFEVIGGDAEQKWLILRNGDATIGLFQGMFEKNIITFNPSDARSIQKTLKDRGVAITHGADESGDGPAHLTLIDPDGNPVLIDQH